MYNKYVFEKYEDTSKVDEFSKDYIDFLSNCKSERLVVDYVEKIAKEKGFKSLDSYKKLKAGDKVYVVNRRKNIVLFVIGEEEITNGLNVLGAHIDSPRLDIKQNPFYESTNFALMDTHYYGGIKKYQWVTIPLALVGVVCKKDGEVIDVNIGLDEKDPVLGVTDLLIHLSADQMSKKASEVVTGENLDVLCGLYPLKDEEKDAVKNNVLRILKEKYDVEEDDFVSAEIEVVPAFKAREFGLDRSMIAAYGHDDRVCAYTSFKAILDMDKIKRTSCCTLVDKEEVGSIGATGAQSKFFEDTVAEIIGKLEDFSFIKLRKTLTNSNMLSSDVSAGVDPLYLSVNESKNSAYLGKGIVFNKYTGARGKSGCNDANAEFIAKLRKIMDEGEIYYQTSELGKVDQGGGGTIAYILANLNMNVIDAGVPVLSMHSPMEIVAKVDVYEAYLAYKVFLEKA
jgi:aspartyl aminopeptidase